MQPDPFMDLMHFGFALYGFQPNECPIGILYQWALDWFDRLGCVPHLADADIGGKSGGHYKSFRSIDRKVRQAVFTGMTQFSCLSIHEDRLDDEYASSRAAKLGVTYGTDVFSKSLVFYIREELVRDRMGLLKEAAREACELLRPAYGIGYRQQQRYQPDVYGMGMSGGNPDPWDANLTYWSFACQREYYSLLRGVYPWNFLTGNLLGQRVGKDHLGDWICSDSSRGQLAPLTNQITLWTVTDENLQPVREALWNAGIILDPHRHIEPLMAEYRVGWVEVINSLKTGIPLVRRAPTPPASDEEVLRRVLSGFGGPERTVFVVEKPGELRELPQGEASPTKGEPTGGQGAMPGGT